MSTSCIGKQSQISVSIFPCGSHCFSILPSLFTLAANSGGRLIAYCQSDRRPLTAGVDAASWLAEWALWYLLCCRQTGRPLLQLATVDFLVLSVVNLWRSETFDNWRPPPCKNGTIYAPRVQLLCPSSEFYPLPLEGGACDIFGLISNELHSGDKPLIKRSCVWIKHS